MPNVGGRTSLPKSASMPPYSFDRLLWRLLCPRSGSIGPLTGCFAVRLNYLRLIAGISRRCRVPTFSQSK